MTKTQSVVILLLMFVLSACAEDIRFEAQRQENKAKYGWGEVACINGVLYYKSIRGLAVAMDRESKVIPCEDKP